MSDSSSIDNAISGIHVAGGALAVAGGPLHLRNTSFSGNRATGGRGGGLLHRSGQLDARHVAFSGNEAETGAHLALGVVSVLRWTYTILGPGIGETPCELSSSSVGTLTGNLFESACAALSGSGALLGPVGAITLDASALPAMLVPGPDSPAIDIVANAAHALPLDARGTLRPQDGNGDNIGRADAGPIEVRFLRTEILTDGFEALPPG